ncbi:MAG TPA: porin [Candidatus Dormibacteraeota bacterium]|nr:porin [Candidatus Dormibacteraeota bacterium]
MKLFSKCCFSLLFSLVLALCAAAQTGPALTNSNPPVPPATGQAPPAGAATQEPAAPAAQAPAAPAPAAPAPPTWSAGPIDFAGFVDGYYSFNFNHPASGNNQLYNFNVKANQFSLNMAKISLSHSADPVGFQVDFGFGRAFDIIANAGERQPEIWRYIEQAYVSWKPAAAKGLQLDFGKFVTSAGAEVIETNGNWNYSRSLLFSWAIPYYHFGLRTSFPAGKHFTGGVQVVNGWNNVEDNNSGKTIGLTGTFTTKKFSWSNNYYGGPENPGTNKGWRHMYDTTLLLTPSGKVNAYINFDYGQNRNFPIVVGAPAVGKWYGVAGALHLQFTDKWAFTPRFEWLADPQGFATGTGVSQSLKEGTITGEYKMLEGLLARLEYRHDWSNQPFFQRGATLSTNPNFSANYLGFPGTYKSQDTLTLGVLVFFGPKR